MLLEGIAAYFKYKVVGSIVLLSCFPQIDQLHLVRQLSSLGHAVTTSSNTDTLNKIQDHQNLGVIYWSNGSDTLLDQIQLKYWSHWYKWLIISDNIPKALKKIRYDADITFINTPIKKHDLVSGDKKDMQKYSPIFFDDVYYHPRDGVSIHHWAFWVKSDGFQLTHDRERNLRRLDLKKFPLKVATPMGHYSAQHDGVFSDYLENCTYVKKDALIRSSYAATYLITSGLNSTVIIEPTTIYITFNYVNDNVSMMGRVSSGQSHISGGTIRFLQARFNILDYITPIWPFSAGFTYLAERESSSNMFVEPFTVEVWWCCLGITFVLVLAQRITAKSEEEKESACVGVLATCLQQDASAVPKGVSGRWTFTVLSISSMLVHAYYTSAIVSSLMSAGRSGPETIRALADSNYPVACDDHDYLRRIIEHKNDRSDIEYFKVKKSNPNMYQNTEKGPRLIELGYAFHTEYNNLFPLLTSFSDELNCKLKYVDSVPESMAWLTVTKRSEYLNVFRSMGSWIHETGLVKHLITQWKDRPPVCRASLLAERVKFGDIAPALGVTVLGAIVAVGLLGLELVLAKWQKKENKIEQGSIQQLE